jgi:subtilisin family serine protease
VRWLTKAIAGASALGLVGVMASQAAATPGPRKEEWYFTSWEIQNKVWPITKGNGVTVAVLDSGVNAGLPDLAGRILPGTDVARENGGDGRQDTSTWADGHGTGMAALIVGQGSGPAHMVGVAPEAKVLPVVTTVGDWALGIRYAVDHGAKVVSISQGSAAGNCDRNTQQAVGYALDHDVVVVASAGNEGDRGNKPSFPASCDGVLAVGAVNFKNTAWSATQRQPYVTVAAPGVLVQSLSKNGSFTRGYSGTSQAAALTSGAVALVRSKYPDMSAREVVQRIIASARDSGPQPGKDLATGYGAVRPAHALLDKVPRNAPNPVFAKYDQWKKSQGGADSSGGGASAPAASGGKDSGSNTMLLAVAAVVVLAGIAVGLILWMRNRSRRTPAMPYGQPGQPPYQQAGQPYQQGGPPYQEATPPSFGAPPGGPGPHTAPPPPRPGHGSQAGPPAPYPPQGPPQQGGPR